MKLNKLAVACGLAVAAMSAPSFAHDIHTTSPDVTVYISGSSALQKTLGKFAESMMNAGTIDVYYGNATGSNYRAYFGTVPAATMGTATDKKVLLIERASGGSIMGVNPVAKGQAIKTMLVDNTCTAVAGAVYPAATFKCAGTTLMVPDAGVSDVEPAMFVGQNIPAGVDDAGLPWSGLNAAELGALSPFSQYAVIMGIAVTDNLALTGMSRSQITSLLSNQVTGYATWNLIDPSLSGPVTIERRTAGSGTQASANAYFGGFPCSSAAITLADATNTAHENAATGDVINSMNANFAAGTKSIGLISTENQPGAADHWHFVSIDGIAPTQQNTVDGKYDYFVEQSMQWRNSDVNGNGAYYYGRVANAVDPLKTAFLDAFKLVSGNPPASYAGIVNIPGVATPLLDVAGHVTNNVMKGTKQTNTCAPTQLYF